MSRPSLPWPLPLICILTVSLMGCASTRSASAPPPSASPDEPFLTDAHAEELSAMFWARPELANLVTTPAERAGVISCVVEGIRSKMPNSMRAQELGQQEAERLSNQVGADCMLHFRRSVLSATTFGPSYRAVYVHECSQGSPEDAAVCACLAENAAAHFPTPRDFFDADQALVAEEELSEQQAARVAGLSEACRAAAAAG